MKKNLLLTICFMLIVPPGAYANNVQTLTINGQTVNKALSKMTFDGDNVILTFTDNSSQTSEMESVSLSFSSASAIDAVSVFQYNGIVGDVGIILNGYKELQELQHSLRFCIFRLIFMNSLQ